MKNLIYTLLLLASLGLFFGYINPTYRGVSGSFVLKEKSIVELREDKARYTDALTKVREIELARTGLLEKYNGIAEEDRGKLLKFLPDHVDSVRLIIDINNIAAQHGMTLRNIALFESEEGGAPTSESLGPSLTLHRPVEFRFSISGSYDALRAFLHDLEQSLRLIDVQNLAFSAGAAPVYDYTVTIHTYRLK